jgi:hypothetical protein
MWNVSMNKIQSVAFVVGVVTGILLILNAQATTFAQSGTQSNVASGEFVTKMGEVKYYTFSVPGDAVNPRLIGQYQVNDGQTIKVNILDQEGCPSPLSAFDCTSIYTTPNRDRGNVDVSLTPGKTYYLEFNNDEWFTSKTTHVDFHIHSE